MVVALAVLGLGASATGGAAVSAGRMAALGLVAVVAAGAAVLVAGGARRGRGLALAAGVLYGTADAGAKGVAVAAGHAGVAGALLGPWGAMVTVASVGAFLCFQRALQLGPAVPVIALMTGGTTVAGIVAGRLVFGDPIGGPALAPLHLTAFAVATVAGLVLAGTQARGHGRDANAIPNEGQPAGATAWPA
jgi:hypothetical protein